jgi:hypothetical protein
MVVWLLDDMLGWLSIVLAIIYTAMAVVEFRVGRRRGVWWDVFAAVLLALIAASLLLP